MKILEIGLTGNGRLYKLSSKEDTIKAVITSDLCIDLWEGSILLDDNYYEEDLEDLTLEPVALSNIRLFDYGESYIEERFKIEVEDDEVFDPSKLTLYTIKGGLHTNRATYLTDYISYNGKKIEKWDGMDEYTYNEEDCEEREL